MEKVLDMWGGGGVERCERGVRSVCGTLDGSG